MLQPGYQIKLYQPNLVHQVVNLLSFLWGDNYSQNLAYFQWKYHENPVTENPLGIVTLYKGKVVAFRGYFATKWKIQEKNHDIFVLCPGDTVVDPDHRRKKLSVIMGGRAMDEYASNYTVFFNFSATKNSVPGYLRMGFVPIGNKGCLNRDNIFGLTKFIFAANKKEKLHKGKITFGDFGDIVVSDSPHPKEMSAIVYRQKSQNHRIALLQDKDFYSWRFGNHRKKYVFYYYRQNQVTSGYIVINVSENNKRGYIADFSEKDSLAIEKILEFIIKMKHFDILSIYNYSLNKNLSQILRKFRFKDNSLTRIIEKRKDGEYPLFIRPVKRDYSESDFLIEGLDIRKTDSWKLKEICSDGA